MFKTRVISGAVLTILAIVILYFGGYVTGAATLLLSLGGIFELLRIYKLEKSGFGVIAYLAAIVYYIAIALGRSELFLPVIVGFVLIELAFYVVNFPKFKDRDVEAAVLSFFYVAVMLSYVYQIRLLEHGLALVVMIFICSWINDTFAYLVGVNFGKHKMTPKLSPKKSIEGLIGGIAGAAVIGAIYGVFINAKVYHINGAAAIFAIIGAVGAGFAVIGDLAASAVKRDKNIKDYGKLIPGHGGIMDRFDSIIFTAPAIYYCMKLMLDIV
jgi:phosphatidate cytidylyltransferase